jgi:hypothetical protein
MDAAEYAIERLPDAWLRSITEHAGTCFNGFRSASSVESKLAA